MDSSSENNKNAVKHSSNKAKNTNSKQWQNHVGKARRMLSAQDYGKAMSYFAFVVHHAPELKCEIQEDFLFALKSWCVILGENGKTEDIVRCLNEARRIFPNSAAIANYVGSVLFQMDMFDEASVYFRHALTLDPGLLPAQEGLDSVSNLLVERWHFRMLNDQVRNKAYKNAIERAVSGGCTTVLDIGSGSGILSMYAVQCGAEKVFACEMSKTMYDLSLKILESNMMNDQIKVINKSSYDLKIPDDLPDQVSLVVTETLDCGLLGEGILSTLAHAQQYLIATHGGKISSVTYEEKSGIDNQMFVNAVGTRNIIPKGAIVYAQIIECEKIRNYSRVDETKSSGLCLGSVNIYGAEISGKCQEPYTTEDFSCVPHTPLSKPFCIMTYDFQVAEQYLCEQHKKISIPVMHGGCLDAVITWFELKLDEYEILSSAPGCSTCWEQAVYPIKSNKIVEKGDKVVVDCKFSSKAILVDVDILVPQKAVVDPAMEKNAMNFVLPFSEVSKLNDISFNQCYQNGIREAFNEILSRGKSPVSCLALCSSPTFTPLFSMAAGFSNVLCRSKDGKFNNCLEILRSTNDLPETLQFTDCNLEELYGVNSQYHLLVVDPVETSGVLRQELVQDIVFCKGCILAREGGIVLPRKIEIWGVLITSELLCLKSCVINDDVTLGLKIATHMNQFTVRNQIDVDVMSNPHTAMTEPCCLLTLDFMSSTDDETLLKLLNMVQQTEVGCIKAGCAQGLMYWFEMDFSKEQRLSTGPHMSSHFNQVVIVFDDKIKVENGERLMITTSCNASCITASVEPLEAQE